MQVGLDGQQIEQMFESMSGGNDEGLVQYS
jgi:hypothetical protein